MNPAPTPRTVPRYGCHECREDLETVMSGRATDSVRQAYEGHLRGCRDCRRVHRLLLELYEDPFDAPPEPPPEAQDQQFARIMAHTSSHATAPTLLGSMRTWLHRLPPAPPAWSLGLAGAAVIVALVWQPSAEPDDRDLQADLVALADAESLGEGSGGGIDHPAQGFARLLAGTADVDLPGARDPSGNTFPVGTRFKVPLHHGLQLTLAGKVLGNFTPGTEFDWTQASPELIRVDLRRGLLAMRYDRRTDDPILEINTPSAVVRVVGTVFTVQVDSEGDTTVSVLRGEVEVLGAEDGSVVAEVQAGYRYESRNATFSDVGRAEVTAALPLSNDPESMATGQIPASWVVPGLPAEPSARLLSAVPSPERVAEPPRHGPVALVTARRERHQPRASDTSLAAREDDGEELLTILVRDAQRSRQAEIRATMERCRRYYEDTEERYRAATCLASFLKRYGNSPLAVEGYLLVGILRMDYAMDFDAADMAFQEFLSRAPHHAHAELARYRLWLSATEDGRISQALERGREYLQRYPNGRYVGRVLQRFPELKSTL